MPLRRDEILTAAQLAGHGALKLASVYMRQRRPFILNHLITIRCNLDCPFCYVSGPEQLEFNRVHYPKQEEMNTDEVRNFYKQLVAHGFKLAVIVGGEPLLRSDLDRLIAELDGHIFTSVFSNGMVLAERCDLIRKASSLIVSLDAPDEQHDTLRARPGCFRRAMAGIEAVRSRHPKIKLALMMTVTDQNVHRVRDMIDFAHELDLPIGFQPPTYEGQFGLDDRPNEECSQRVPPSAPLTDAFRVILEASKRQRILASRAFFELIIDDRRTFPCHYPTYVLGPVYPNGDVLACTSATMIANLRASGVADILESPRFQANAEAGPTCRRGCRDWGIHDISALHNRQVDLSDLRRYYNAFVV